MKSVSFTMKVAVASILLASTASVAFAKNFKDAPVYKDQPCPPPATLKDGFYVGAQAGYDSYRNRQSINSPGTSTIIGTTALNATGWMGGLFLGYDQNLNEWFNLGGEIFVNTSNADINYAVTRTDSYSSKFEVNSSYGLAVLPGLRVTDSMLTYLRLGWNWANLKLNETANTASTSKSNTSNGFNLGLGMETLLKDNWSLRTEYSHTWYNDFNTDFSTSVNPSDNQYTLGLIYHFA